MEGLRRGNRSSNAVSRKTPQKVSHCQADRWGIFSSHSHSNQPKECKPNMSMMRTAIAMSEANHTRHVISPLKIK